MLKLRTKTAFNVPDGRGVKSVIVRMITSHFSMLDINNVKVEGYYYYLDENQNVVKLSDFGQNSMKLWDDITALENMEGSPLADFASARNLKSVIIQRLTELTFLQLMQEETANYGTVVSDWEVDNS